MRWITVTVVTVLPASAQKHAQSARSSDTVLPMTGRLPLLHFLWYGVSNLEHTHS